MQIRANYRYHSPRIALVERNKSLSRCTRSQQSGCTTKHIGNEHLTPNQRVATYHNW
ncbi:Uncharacterised protein [Vibrio cholerae]|uniref:Uncharacterized protein n=1 Tax=Vibrio cholerae TaxID=666 RepID=A0A656AWQ3_VIBCL|nr:Uncharacterised protein [Vibrio cholerae]CSB26589.1 Uncharacterised protein [Vibrio cholerae]CSD45956.1 Uncharacterised protein [Vibrio cholerae]